MKKTNKIGLFLIICMIILPSSVALSAKKNPINEYSTNILKMQMKEKNMRILLDKTLLKISEECCEDNYIQKDRILEIKVNINKCLNSEDKKCFKGFAIYIKKPPKLILLEQVDEVEKLLLENKRQKYDNDLKNEELAIEKSSQDYNELKKSNDKLKKRIENMLNSYEQRINDLEEANAKLQEEYSKAYEMLSKRQKKKLEKEYESQ